MNCSCVVPRSRPISARRNPTYEHQPIFFPLKDNPQVVYRCNPTYHSTALDFQGYQLTTNQHLHQKRTQKTKSHTMVNVAYDQSKQRKMVQLNPNVREGDVNYRQQFEAIKKYPMGFARERLLVELIERMLQNNVNQQYVCQKEEGIGEQNQNCPGREQCVKKNEGNHVVGDQSQGNQTVSQPEVIKPAKTEVKQTAYEHQLVHNQCKTIQQGQTKQVTKKKKAKTVGKSYGGQQSYKVTDRPMTMLVRKKV